jgi:hypothetical protein
MSAAELSNLLVYVVGDGRWLWSVHLAVDMLTVFASAVAIIEWLVACQGRFMMLCWM